MKVAVGLVVSSVGAAVVSSAAGSVAFSAGFVLKNNLAAGASSVASSGAFSHHLSSVYLQSSFLILFLI